MPQGSVLWPSLVLLYAAELHQLIFNDGLELHTYADDIQLYDLCFPSSPANAKYRRHDNIRRWLDGNKPTAIESAKK